MAVFIGSFIRTPGGICGASVKQIFVHFFFTVPAQPYSDTAGVPPHIRLQAEVVKLAEQSRKHVEEISALKTHINDVAEKIPDMV